MEVPTNSLVNQASFGGGVNGQGNASLSVKNADGDTINFSLESGGSTSFEASQTTGEDGAIVQSFSVASVAANNFSISVEGDLTEEELAAVVELADKFLTAANGFFQGNDDFEGASDSLTGFSEDFDVLSLDIEQAIQQAFGGSTGTQTFRGGNLDETEVPEGGEIDAAPTGIRNPQGLTQSVADAVFGSGTTPDSIFKSVNQLIEEFFQNFNTQSESEIA